MPQATNSGGPKQLATTVAAGDFDVDGGTTTIRSPAIALPSTGVLTLTFSYYFAHANNNSSTADFFRVKMIVRPPRSSSKSSAPPPTPPVWVTGSANITSFAGQTVRIQIEAADASTASLVEAAVDDVKIVQP